MELFRLEDVSFAYGEELVLKNIDLTVEEGDFIGILGPNGSGKSTLLKVMSGLLHPDKGRVFLGDREVHRISPGERARIIGVGPQETYLDFPFMLEEVVAMGRYPHLGWWGTLRYKDMEYVEEALATTGLLELRQRSIHQLSGGERQRGIIARALAQNPRVLLLDEPVSNLDIKYQQGIFELLLKLNRQEGLTIILVSHDLNLASQYCQNLVLLDQGQLRAVGSAEEVLTPENIAKVYQVEVDVEKWSPLEKPRINLRPPPEENGSSKKIKPRRIHIVGGGGSAWRLSKRLNAMGHLLSLGAVNEGDTDSEGARELGIECIREVPFHPITEGKLKQTLELMLKADLVVVSEVPFGRGNIGNLKMALEALKKGKEVFVLDGENIANRDFTGGEASELWQEMKKKGARSVNPPELEQILKEGE